MVLMLLDFPHFDFSICLPNRDICVFAGMSEFKVLHTFDTKSYFNIYNRS